MKIFVLMTGRLSSTLAFFWAKKHLGKDLTAIHYYLKGHDERVDKVKGLMDHLGFKAMTMPIHSYWFRQEAGMKVKLQAAVNAIFWAGMNEATDLVLGGSQLVWTDQEVEVLGKMKDLICPSLVIHFPFKDVSQVELYKIKAYQLDQEDLEALWLYGLL